MCKKLIYLASFVLVLGLVLTSLAGAADPDLIGWWPLNEGSGDTVFDLSASGNNGTINNFDGGGLGNNGLVWVNDPERGMVVSFNGNNSSGAYISTDLIIPFMDLNNDFTWALWVKQEGDGTGANMVIAGNRYGGTPTPGSGQFIKFTSTRFEYYHGGHNGTIDYDDPTPGEWVHMVVVKEGPTLTHYRNAEPAGTGTTTATIDENPFGMGADATNAAEMWSGHLSDVRLYTKALTVPEILGAMQGSGEVWPYASSPTPADGAMYTDTWVNLSWRAGGHAVSHDVYFGNNFDDVNAGAEGVFQGNQAATNLIAGFPGFAYPDGLVPGTTYYWRIDEVNDTEPNSPWKGDVWSFTVPPKTAYEPNPADGAKFVFTDVELNWTPGLGAQLHYVYFGNNFDDVNNAVVGLPQGTTTYTPGTLELDKTYYWRIDEFDGAATHKGDVLSFRTMPEIPITDPNLICWWTLDEGAGSTALDWSGHGNHGVLFGPEWAIPGLLGDAALNFSRGGYVAIQNLSYNSTDNTEVTVCAWIRTSSSADQYIASFDRDNYWRLEINGSGGGPGQVGWDVMTSSGQVDYGSSTRVDDGLWHHVTGVYDHGRLTIYIDGRPEASVSGGNTFGSGNPRFGFIGANSEATSFNGSRGGGSPISGDIDELRIYDKALTVEEIQLAMRGDPLLAWGPSPANGSTPYIRDATPLSWSPGDNASQHDVYFGTDRGAVADADASDTTGIYRGRQGGTIYTPAEGVEWGGGPYYWRVDEYNTDATISKGNVWTFTVADSIVIEDFEDYNDYPPDEIFNTWIDGYGTTTNGSTAGYAEPDFLAGEHYIETTIVHGGAQSMPLFYENNFKYSEATMTLVSARNWTEEGVGVLSLWFYGDASNAAERMYVALNGSATVYHDNPNAALLDEWTQWPIDLQEFAAQGVNLTNVNTITIGFGDKNNLQAGGSGMVFFDDIRLYRPAEPEP